ncbi:MAG: N4-gp56 family major capsid protein [Salinibacterium sp.]|nr:N4-gp56 family major capsid protein [Salinibacterium sp.]
MQTFQTLDQRIGILRGEILAHAMHKEVLGITGVQRKTPKNKGETIKYRRFIPWGASVSEPNRPAAVAAAHILSEGVTPEADTITAVDISVTMEQYGCLYAVTNKTWDLHEDDIPGEMKKQVGERAGLVREMIRYGTLKAGTNAYYSGGNSRSTVSKKVRIPLLRAVTRNLRSNHCDMITGILSPSPNFNTTSVEASWLVFCHSDCEQDIRDMDGFKHPAEYGNRKPVHECEIGSVESFRFVISPELAPYLGAGASVTGTGLQSIGASNVDVYPMIVVGEQAWGQVALRGVDSLDPTWIPPGQKDKQDPLGQRGYIGANFWQAAVILNQGWMAVVEVGVTDLDALN